MMVLFVWKISLTVKVQGSVVRMVDCLFLKILKKKSPFCDFRNFKYGTQTKTKIEIRITKNKNAKNQEPKKKKEAKYVNITCCSVGLL